MLKYTAALVTFLVSAAAKEEDTGITTVSLDNIITLAALKKLGVYV